MYDASGGGEFGDRIGTPPWDVAVLATDPAWLEASYALFDRVEEFPFDDPGRSGSGGTCDEIPPVDFEALAERPRVDSFTFAELERALGSDRDLSGIDEYDLVELIALWRQLESACAGGVRATSAELAGRVPMSMDKPAVLDRRTNFRSSIAAEEIAPRLGCSKREANRLISVGKLQDTIAAPTGDALAAGLIDAAKADLIATAVSVLDAEPALAVQAEILPKAPGWTRYRLEREIATAVAQADPTNFTQRARVASEKRYVSRARMVADGMATQTLYWPAVDALTFDLTLDAAAATARAAGDPRTLEQLRPDILADLIAHHLATGQIGPHPQPAAGPTTDPASTIAVTGASDTTAPTTVAEQPTGTAADAVAEQPTATDTAAEQAGGANAVTAGAKAPVAAVTGGAAPPAAPGAAFGIGTAAGPATDPGTGSSPLSGSSSASGVGDPNLATPAGRGAPRTWPIGILGGHRAQIVVHVPLSTLLGGDEPGNVEGLGPIPADVAAAIAAGGTWTRLVTDPLTNKIVDYGTTRYEPPQNMIDRVKANEPDCIAPGCSASARQTELNHRVPYPIGPTSDDNLDPMCRRDHVLVTHGEFSYERAPDGTITWHTPTGHTYQRDPNGTITKLSRDIHHPGSNGKARYRTPDPRPVAPDEPPPF
ncbi:HNH endonuclease signature motif containing protein [Occultella kanbiaonis]|uniref:HNH endonuclease signature motif containing protein n=1 Tax=Occultella kanbiaonis TaxID=2675754 RepID=UPI0013D5150C|nr:HNH endonuclease signature motif containing protein [Occultella kanbiaonis]